MTRTASITPLALALALTGCLDLGLEGNVPLESATARPPSDLVVAVHARGDAQAPGMVVDGRMWVPFGLPHGRDADALRSVGAASGQTVHALSWDAPPFDRLFTADEATGAWQEWAPVIGRTGAATAADAEHPADPGTEAPAAAEPAEPGTDAPSPDATATDTLTPADAAGH